LRPHAEKGRLTELVTRTAPLRGKLEVAPEVVEGVAHDLGEREVRRVDRRNPANADVAAPVTERTTAQDLQIRPAGWIVWVRIQRRKTRWTAAASAARFDDEEEARADRSLEEQASVGRTDRSDTQAVGIGKAQVGEPRPDGRREEDAQNTAQVGSRDCLVTICIGAFTRRPRGIEQPVDDRP
jgi:hypothetical protein